MASILRSSKFVRYIAGFARNVVLNTPREFDGTLFNNTAQCFCGALPRSLASQVPAQHDQNLEHSLKRIDQDVRKSGRISRRDIEDVLEEIRSSRSATSSQSLLVIRCCGNLVPEELPEVRTRLVQEIWTTLKKLNVPMDISHYNALLRVYLENEHQFSPTDFLADLESKGIEPNRVTYQRLIARYCQVGDIEGATKILEYMREKQLPVNENVFNALIVGHSQAGDLESARGILGVMTQAGLEPSADTYTTLLCGYGRNGQIDLITQLFQECESKEVHLLDKDYLDVVYALATNGHSQHIGAVLEKVNRSIGYNQDAINLILRLINKGLEDSAYAVFQSMGRPTREDGSSFPIGHFFIRQLIKADRPVDKILEICQRFISDGAHERPLLLAAEHSLQLGNDKLAYPLLVKLRENNVAIRQHFFWPLIISKASDPSGKAIIEVLQQMGSFNITPNMETIREYVIPNLKGKSGQILAQLRTANVSVGAAASALVHHLLQKNDIEEAALLSGQVVAYYPPDLLKRPLTNALYKTKNVDAYLKVLRNFYEHFDRKPARSEDETEESVNKTEIVGSFILDLATNQKSFLELIEAVLEGLIQQGLTISTSSAEKLQDKLGGKMTENISSQLGKLSSGDLTPIPVVAKKLPAYTPSSQMNIPQLERLVHNLEAKNQDTKGLKRQLLSLYCRDKDLQKTEALLDDLKDGIVMNPGVHAQLADLYAHHTNVDKALHHYNQLKSGPDFALDDDKAVSIVECLVKVGRLQDAVKILEEIPRSRKREERNFSYSAQVWRFLNSLAEEGKVEELNTIFEALIANNYIEATNILLGPLIKVHLVKQDLDKALEKFELCVHQYKSTPWKNELACKLIQTEDAEKLQKLTDLSTTVHGEINSLYDLVFAFVECGRVRQARKILETPGLQNRPQRINTACERYRQEGLVQSLEGLKDATKDLNHIDRGDIYYQLLLSYIKSEDVEKALGLWTQTQEEDLLPSEQFLSTLASFLKQKGLEVPFVFNDPKPEPVVKPGAQNLRQKLKVGDIDGALQLFNSENNGLSITDSSLLIEKLTQSDRIREATKITFNLLENNVVPINRVFRFLLNKLAANGDVEALSRIGDKISQDVKKLISFDNRFCHANLIAGKAESYLNFLNSDIENARKEDLAVIAEKFPRGGAYGILERHPELVDQYENLAIKYQERDIIAPLNVLWTYYFINHKNEKAEDIWSKYLKDAPRIMFQRIVHAARDNKDETLINKLIGHLKISNVTEGAIGNAYSCLLDVLVSNEKEQEVITAFESALKDVSINHINRTAIIRVKEVYDKLGKPFNHVIPPKNVKNVSNTSSTSDEDTRKA